MKCAIVLLALVAVSQAAFTSRLQQRASPLVQDAVSKMRVVAGRASFRQTEVATSIIDTLQAHANDLLQQIDNAVQHGQTVANTLVQEFQATVAQLQNLGSELHAGASGILSDFLSGLGGLFGGLFGGAGKLDVSAIVAQLIEQFNIEHHVSNALNHNVVQWVATVISSLGGGPMVHNAVSSVLGSDLADYIFSHFNQNSKGIFSGVSSVVSSLNAAAQQALANIGSVVQQLVAVAETNFAELQTMATQFAQEALGEAQATVAAAAHNFLELIKPYQAQAGEIYQQVVTAVQAIIGKN